MAPAIRKLALTVHLTCSVGWIGAVVAYLVLGTAAVTSPDPQIVRAAWTAMDLTGWWAIVPLAVAALLTGLVMSVGTQWGLFRHYWVLISFGVTVLCTVVLVLHMPTVSAIASMARQTEGADLRALGGDLFHPAAGLLLLVVVTVLNVYKPAGLTPYGWRKQREQRESIWATPPSGGPARIRDDVRRLSTFRTLAAKITNFIFHFAEMWLVMMLGMAAFMLLRLVLTARGYAAMLDLTFIQFQVGMCAFMVLPIVGWMRLRGCGWRQCGAMSSAMMLSTGAVLVLRGLELHDALAWLASNQHAVMLLGMLAFMLFRRQHFTSEYSFPRISATVWRHLQTNA